jgi:hypothetical protein
MTRSITCTKCNSTLPGELFNTPNLVPCPQCGAPFRVEVFPALFRRMLPGAAGQQLIGDSQSSCFYHPRKQATIPCDSCGRFLCALCDVELNGQHLFPVCLETGKTKGKLKSLQNHRVLYDNLALALAILPLLIFWFTLVTAPMVIYVVIRYWHAPTSILPRSKVRMILSLTLASLQILGWAVGFYYLAHRS